MPRFHNFHDLADAIQEAFLEEYELVTPEEAEELLAELGYTATTNASGLGWTMDVPETAIEAAAAKVSDVLEEGLGGNA